MNLLVVNSAFVFQTRVKLAVVVFSRGIVRVRKPFLNLGFFHR